MNDEKTWSLAYTLYLQGCPRSFTCLGIEHWVKGTILLYIQCDRQAAEFLLMKVNFLNSWAPHLGFKPRTLESSPNCDLEWWWLMFHLDKSSFMCSLFVYLGNKLLCFYELIHVSEMFGSQPWNHFLSAALYIFVQWYSLSLKKEDQFWSFFMLITIW